MKLVNISLLFLALYVPSCLWAAEPPREPILRLETGMHGAMIHQIGVDAANRFLVTGSLDKTVRVWNLATGELLRVLRPPIGPGNEGKINAVAISPDGNTIACGGWTELGSESGATIYLFDRSSGQMVQRISGLPDVISSLVYSPDGRYLAATLCEGDGLRVYRAPQYEEVAKDSDYGGSSYSADFAADGRLVTACWDGFVRLYDASFQLKAKERAPGGNKPHGVAFSPDGAKIAVGFEDSTKVNLLSARDLTLLVAPDTTDVDNGNLSEVAFSADGQRFYAGGRYWRYRQGRAHIRIWEQAGRGAYRDVASADQIIMHILSLGDGGVVYGTGEPSWGVLDAGGTRRVFQKPNQTVFAEHREQVIVSTDGSRVSFGTSSMTFSTLTRELAVRFHKYEGWPVIVADGLQITDWGGEGTPALNGRRLELNESETSYSLAIAPNSQTFLLGTGWYLRLFDREGKEKWNVPVPDVAWKVNIAGNGQVAVAGLNDGTVRWYRMSDGQELMAFFLHGDRKRWILWTPTGYYDCSPGAEELIGWHVNNGADAAADFYPVSRFRRTFYRPDVISKILDARDEAEAVRLANAEAGRKAQTASVAQLLPPVVTVLSPRDGDTVSAEEIEVKYTTRAADDAPVTSVRALVDGRPVDSSRGIKVEAAVAGQSLKVRLPGRDCEVALVAENRHGASVPFRVRLKWGGKPTEESVIKPRLIALVVGVSKYADASIRLKYAAKDANDFAAVLKRLKGSLYSDVVVKLLTDEKAAKDDVLDGLDWVRKETTQDDVAVVYLSGHGVNEADGSYYYLPVNVNVGKLMSTGVEYNAIVRTVASITGKAVFFVDTCHAGNVMGGRRGLNDITRVINELSSAENGAVVFASSKGSQYSLENDEWQNGAFTKALVEGLIGKADYGGKGTITINMLDLWLSERVKELTGGKQDPATAKPLMISDFPVAMPVR